MPGSEPWVRVVTAKGEIRLPAQCSLLELLEMLGSNVRRPKAPSGEVMVRVPLGVVLSSPTIGEYRRRRADQSD
jgi:hypothetical protein